ncbi:MULTISPECIES: glucosamine-6-phosphate deaminase [unclassified Virgibacillus]|uniref:glucosamine-6-phosphate deaminase n=1 Tax=unclassified Virgibacillus TaxID=2620237 RepID=UPI0024DEBE8C|nr:glucosamine-6-phosphate deaminase [Virgibacillus sp. LDC-1]
MQIIKTANYEAMSEKAYAEIVEIINSVENPVLGLATGSTPEGLYQHMIEQYNQGNLTLKKATTFNLDEYVGLDAADPNSYRYYMNDKLFQHIDIQKGQSHLPNGSAQDLEQECNDYEQKIKQAGNIDVQILGLGLNGHIGFNEPGTSFESRTHVIELDASTREANARFFSSLDAVPTQAITMGIETIMESKAIILLVSGENKADAVARLVEGEISEEFPASILQKHGNVTLIADEAALSKVEF